MRGGIFIDCTGSHILKCGVRMQELPVVRSRIIFRFVRSVGIRNVRMRHCRLQQRQSISIDSSIQHCAQFPHDLLKNSQRLLVFRKNLREQCLSWITNGHATQLSTDHAEHPIDCLQCEFRSCGRLIVHPGDPERFEMAMIHDKKKGTNKNPLLWEGERTWHVTQGSAAARPKEGGRLRRR